MLSADALRQVVKDCAGDTFTGRLYRAVQLQYLPTLTSTEGAWKAPNRYTAAEVSHALYVAMAPDLAMLEATRQFQRNFDTPTFPAYCILPADVDLRRILDLTRDAHQDALGTSIEELSGDWRAAHSRQLQQPERRVVTHDLGRAAKDAGFEGLKYFSAYDAARWNIVIFTENLTEERQVIFDLPPAAIEAASTLKKPRKERTKRGR